jgi:hypothetical protein
VKKHLILIAILVIVVLVISGFITYGELETNNSKSTAHAQEVLPTYVELYAADGRAVLFPDYKADAQLTVGWYKTRQDAARSKVKQSDVSALAAVMYIEARGLDTREVAMVGWCVLNRVDRGDGTIPGVCYSNQFALYHTNSAYHNSTEYAWLAEDILTRWYLEKMGEVDVGRVLPKDYYWFTGNGKHNYFRNSFYGSKNLESLFYLRNPYQK